MKTDHQIVFRSSDRMTDIPKQSIDLVVTSPPYPMIEMWDAMFNSQNTKIKTALLHGRGLDAFELMHKQLDRVWNEVYRVMKPGGIACINIGDATRTIDGNFMLYPNHSRILQHAVRKGFTSLPAILWRKPTNAPNKFMGSGMLPAGAYVTLEHEYILVLRKGEKRAFSTESRKQTRRQSAYFWEERNQWFSDVWMDLVGTGQRLADTSIRKRSAAFPFELPYRLISMFSAKGDRVLDPFLGIGTTMLAAMAAGRNSIGYEIETEFDKAIGSQVNPLVAFANRRITDRLRSHQNFVRQRFEEKGPFKHRNVHYGFPVITAQEKELLINSVERIDATDTNRFEVLYSERPQKNFCDDREDWFKPVEKRRVKKRVQLSLLD